MSLFKRGKVYWTQFYIDGERYQESTDTTNHRDAETFEQKRKAEAKRARFNLNEYDPAITFGAVATRFVTSGSVRPHHIDRLKLLLPHFADVPVARVTRGMVADYRARRHADKMVTDATINRDLSVLRHVLFWAADENLIPVNPIARMPMMRERRVRRIVMSLEEERRLLVVAADHLRAVVIAALDTGMRRGEILGQRWEHVDLERRVLYVTKSKTPEGEAREIPLTARVTELLTAMRLDEGIVFTYRDQAVRIIKTTWRTALRSAGLRHIRFHDLRHTFNTRLMEAGVMQEIRMALMGHSSGSKVHSTYTHVELPVKREAIARLEQWVTQQTQGGNNASPETGRDGERQDPASRTGQDKRAQAVEKKVAS